MTPQSFQFNLGFPSPFLITINSLLFTTLQSITATKLSHRFTKCATKLNQRKIWAIRKIKGTIFGISRLCSVWLRQRNGEYANQPARSFRLFLRQNRRVQNCRFLQRSATKCFETTMIKKLPSDGKICWFLAHVSKRSFSNTIFNSTNNILFYELLFLHFSNLIFFGPHY